MRTRVTQREGERGERTQEPPLSSWISSCPRPGPPSSSCSASVCFVINPSGSWVSVTYNPEGLDQGGFRGEVAFELGVEGVLGTNSSGKVLPGKGSRWESCDHDLPGGRQIMMSAQMLKGLVSHGAEPGWISPSIHPPIDSANQSSGNWVPGAVVNTSQRTNCILLTTQ